MARRRLRRLLDGWEGGMVALFVDEVVVESVVCVLRSAEVRWCAHHDVCR